MKKQTWQHDLLMRGIKILDFLFIIPMFLISAAVFGYMMDYMYGAFDVEDNFHKSNIRLIFEIIYDVWIILIVGYITRNLIELIPFPLDGYKGYVHSNVRELRSGSLFITIFIIFNNNFRNKMHFLLNRFNLYHPIQSNFNKKSKTQLSTSQLTDAEKAFIEKHKASSSS